FEGARAVAPLLELQQTELARERLVFREAPNSLLQQRARGRKPPLALELADPVGDRPLRLGVTRIEGAEEPIFRLRVFRLHPIEDREVEHGGRVVGRSSSAFNRAGSAAVKSPTVSRR